MSDPAFYSIPFAANELGVSTTTLYRWAYDGLIEASRNPAGQLQIPADVVADLGESMDEPEFYSVKRAASKLGIGAPTLYRWVHQGYVDTARNASRRLRISAETLRDLIAMEGNYPWVGRRRR